MKKYYILKSESEAVASAKVIHEKYNIPIKVIKIRISSSSEISYIVIPNPDSFFRHSSTDEALVIELGMKELFKPSEVIFSVK